MKNKIALAVCLAMLVTFPSAIASQSKSSIEALRFLAVEWAMGDYGELPNFVHNFLSTDLDDTLIAIGRAFANDPARARDLSENAAWSMQLSPIIEYVTAVLLLEHITGDYATFPEMIMNFFASGEISDAAQHFSDMMDEIIGINSNMKEDKIIENLQFRDTVWTVTVNFELRVALQEADDAGFVWTIVVLENINFAIEINEALTAIIRRET